MSQTTSPATNLVLSFRHLINTQRNVLTRLQKNGPNHLAWFDVRWNNEYWLSRARMDPSVTTSTARCWDSLIIWGFSNRFIKDSTANALLVRATTWSRVSLVIAWRVWPISPLTWRHRVGSSTRAMTLKTSLRNAVVRIFGVGSAPAWIKMSMISSPAKCLQQVNVSGWIPCLSSGLTLAPRDTRNSTIAAVAYSQAAAKGGENASQVEYWLHD